MTLSISEYAALDGLGVAELIRSKSVTSREVTEAALRAIAAVNPEINAVVEIYEDCIEQADAALERGGPFVGVPFLIKDCGEHFGGRLMEDGSRLCKGRVVKKDSYFASQIRASGVTLVGRSNTPEFSSALCAENLLYGNTSNPWKINFSTSGSSGGAGAALASGMVPLAHGSDMGGSIRGPAAWCGVVGLMPSRGRVSAGPDKSESGYGTSQNAVMTRSIRDMAAMLDCVSAPQPGDPFVIKRTAQSFSSYLDYRPTPLKIAFSTAPLMDAPVDPEIVVAVEQTAKALEAMGYDITEAAPPIDNDMIDRYCLNTWYYKFDEHIDDIAQSMKRKVGPDTLEKATLKFYEFAKHQSADDFHNSINDLNALRRGVGDFYTQYDVWLTPTCAQTAKPFGTFGMNIDVPPEEFLTHENRPCQFMIVNNLTGQPGLSLPLGQHTNGLPIGVQLSARHAEEHLLVEVGAALESAIPWGGRIPPIHVSNT